ncbi:hypothetical protein ACC691_39705, partial [Rhizobium johnstonii]|uniref:hypothetical protein n=1 Tax=Rhizobium johnstonii TaxID=3019933 RepID=UPI003F97FAFD
EDAGSRSVTDGASAGAAPARRIRVLRTTTTRVGIVWTSAAVYAAIVALVTWQAERGQSIVHPDLPTLLAAAAIAGVGIAGAAISI